jgi:citrate lyase beta subunit
MTGIRISAATPEADLIAAVRPGVTSIYLSQVETSQAISDADALVAHLERLRGIRPRSIALRPLIESPIGITRVHDIASDVERIDAVGTGPHIDRELGGDSLDYSRAECELVARALHLTPIDIAAAVD